MEENRELSYTEEFQITCIDSLPWRRWLYFVLSECGLHTATSFPRVEYGMGEQKSNFTVEKPDIHYFTQVFKVNINNDKSRG